jgi:uncharacterized protein YyaL (SSP411 family)
MGSGRMSRWIYPSEDRVEWSALLTSYSKSCLHFEAQQIYSNPIENARLTEFLAGRPMTPTYEWRLSRVRAALYERRSKRVHPGLDDKILTSWNALALGGLAEAGAVLDEPRYVEAAARCAAFLRNRLVVGGTLHHTWKEGHGATVPAFCEDVAYLAQALLVLYEADHDPDWFNWARRLATQAGASFADGDTGTYFSTAHDAETLVARPKELWDNATPSGASVMVDVHLRLAALTGNTDHVARAERTLAAFQSRATQATRAPWRPSCSAIACPRPRDAPVTSATCPERSAEKPWDCSSFMIF